MRISRRRALTALGAAVVLPAISACSTTPSEQADSTVMLDWVPNTNHTGLYVAQAQGLYNQHNLSVKIVEPGAGGVELAVASGAADFGISYQEQVTLARAEGVPITSIAAVIQQNTSAFASPVDRRIRRPRHFEGMRYGAFGYGSERQVLTALMQCDGGDFSKIEFVDIGATDFFVAWERGDVDFIWIFEGWDGIKAQQRGVELDFIRLHENECVPNFYTPVIVTSEKMIVEKPDVVQRFTRAVKQGYDFAIREPQAAAEILIGATEGLDAGLVRQSQPWLSQRYAEGASRWGEQKQTIWSTYAKWLVDHGLLKRVINPANAFTNEFIKNA